MPTVTYFTLVYDLHDVKTRLKMVPSVFKELILLVLNKCLWDCAYLSIKLVIIAQDTVMGDDGKRWLIMEELKSAGDLDHMESPSLKA